MTAPTSSPPPAAPAGPPGPSAAAQRLEESISVTRPGAWVALAAVGALIAAAVVVALVVHVPKVVIVPATATFPAGRITVTAPVAGTVQDVMVVAGVVVAEGDELATVRAADGTVVPVVASEVGTVLSVPVNVGQAVGTGDALAEISRWKAGSDVSVIAFVDPAQAQNFPPGSKVDVLLRNAVATGTVERVSVVRIPLEAVAEVVGDETLGQAVFERTNGSPVAVTVSLDAGIPAGGSASAGVPEIPEGTAVAVRRVVSDPTLWNVLFGEGR